MANVELDFESDEQRRAYEESAALAHAELARRLQAGNPGDQCEPLTDEEDNIWQRLDVNKKGEI
jgi:hypothetical protein